MIKPATGDLVFCLKSHNLKQAPQTACAFSVSCRANRVKNYLSHMFISVFVTALTNPSILNVRQMVTMYLAQS